MVPDYALSSINTAVNQAPTIIQHPVVFSFSFLKTMAAEQLVSDVAQIELEEGGPHSD